jgi:hypothetical protein
MATKTRIAQLTDALQRFFGLNPEQVFESAPPYQDFDGPNVPESLSTILFLRSVYEPLLSTGGLSALGFHAISQMQSHVQNVVNTYDQFLKSRDQGSFQNFATQLDQFGHQTRVFGIPQLAMGGAQLEAARESMLAELESARANNADVARLKEEVRNLIEPAVAGSLSQQFMSRRDRLVYGRYIWLAACVALGGYATSATYELVAQVSASLVPPTVQSAQSAQPTTSVWVAITLRTLVLVPIFAAFGFSFSQYRKERDFEEEYAHKAAVAHSLPNYGDLARQPEVRDQIVTAASTVIFASPTEQARKLESSSAMLGGLKEMVEALTKAVGKR